VTAIPERLRGGGCRVRRRLQGAPLGDPDDAADATQEIFARALPVLGEVRHPAAWLQTAARPHCPRVP